MHIAWKYNIPDLFKGNNANYHSEKIMAEIVQAIGVTLEKCIGRCQEILIFSVIMDEAIYISVTKQLPD